jgi:hypothetical protein
MTFTQASTENLISHKREDGVYVLEVLKPTRVAVDEWIARVEEIWAEHDQNRKPIPILSDSRGADNIPLNYAFNEGLKVAKRYRNLPQGRTAFIVRAGIVSSLLSAFLRLMPLRIQFRYFDPSQYDEAVNWLREIVKP